jgi:hypothetical protein
MEDVEMGDVEELTPKPKKMNKKKSEVKLGHEFKAKVSLLFCLGFYFFDFKFYR